jgi:hypothetical protein
MKGNMQNFNCAVEESSSSYRIYRGLPRHCAGFPLWQLLVPWYFVPMSSKANQSNVRACLRARVALLLPFLLLHLRAAERISFRNEVMPLISKAGCNAGACHGNANGKASFKLSLRGESPGLDYLALTHDQLTRRIDVFDPDQSLILLKPTTQLAHEGGQRFKINSCEYTVLRNWIASGARDDSDSAATLQKLEVTPLASIISEPEKSIQLSAKVFFSDGTARDVTRIAVYETANPSVRVSHDGMVESEQFGETTVLVRFLNKQIPVRLAFIPLRPNFQWSAPPANNFIDEQIFAKLKNLKTNPSEFCTDEVFVRRAYLDLLGILPTASEARSFVFDQTPNKRSNLVDTLLERPEFADFWALKWSDLLRAEERLLDRKGLEDFHRWVRQSISENKPIDQLARDIISARGSTYSNPAGNFYRANRTAVSRAESAAQLFLGVRVQCAQCHSHPFDRWTQDDYYDWTRVFARLDYKVLENRRRDSNDSHEFKGEQVIFISARGEIKNPRTDKQASPRFLGTREVFKPSEDNDELTALAKWIASPDNPYFAKVQINRIWYHLMGRGLVDPIDDFRATNPPSHPELLDLLAADFIDHRFDLRHAIRRIMSSRAYQLSSRPNETNQEDETNFSHALLRRLTAEQLFDIQGEVTGIRPQINGYPTGTRAIQMAGALPERKRDQKHTEVDQFLAEFGKPPRLLVSECERSCEPTMGQAFQMMSGPVLQEMLSASQNNLSRLLKSGKSKEEMIADLYWAALTRPPTPPELASFKSYLAKAQNPRPALEDIAWSLINSKEFLLRN